MLRLRLITGPILIALLLGVVLLDERLGAVTIGSVTLPPGLAIVAIGAVAIIFGAAELAVLARAQSIAAPAWPLAVAALLILAATYLAPLARDPAVASGIVAAALVAVVAGGLLVHCRGRTTHGVLAATGVMLFAAVHLGALMGFLVALRREHSAWLIIAVVLVVKSGDTGAYFTGRLLGRHKLIPWLSPGKTWEGLVGGVVLAVVAAVLFAAAGRRWAGASDHVTTAVAVVAGVLFALVGQAGDLAVSLLKRGAGVKDSSTLLPGLGGALDVLDSPLMVAPAAWLLLLLA